MANLIKIDRNGSKHYEGYIPCDRCGGQGGSEQWKYTGWTCYKCGGTGKIYSKWIERTPEYEAKLAERRAKRYEKIRAEQEAVNEKLKAERELAEKLEAERKAKEEALEKAQKAISQYVGEVGEKITIIGAYEKSAWFETYDPFGRPEIRYVHTFKDVDGNKFVWKTGCGLPREKDKGNPVEITARIKDHSEYDGEKQTVVKNCKIKWVS